MSRQQRARRVLLGVAVLVGVLVLTAPLLLLSTMSEAEPIEDPDDNSWYLDAMRVPEAQELSTGSDVTVAVIDTGVDSDHPDLAGRVDQGAHFTEEGMTLGGDADADGHGTAMAGLIAADGEVAGVAPDARILPVRVDRRDDGSMDPDLVYAGVRWAIDQGATVVNLSLSGQPTADEGWKRELVEYAVNRNAVLVAAVGNRDEAHTEVGEPAAIPGVLAVTGMSRGGGVWRGAITGDAVVLCAPAENLPHLDPRGDTRSASGTSAATALVSGAVALVQARYPEATAGDVISRLINTAGEVETEVEAEEGGVGYGVVDVHAALTAAVAPGEGYYPLALPDAEESDEAASPREAGAVWLGWSAAMALAVGAVAAIWLVRRVRAERELDDSNAS